MACASQRLFQVRTAGLDELEEFNLGCQRVESEASFPGDAVVLNDLDVLGLARDPRVVQAAKECTARFGVGSCGPRGFYGTTSEHLRAEAAFAEALGAEAAILYSDDQSMRTSVMACFCRPEDYVVCDSCPEPGIAVGLAVARCRMVACDTRDARDIRRAVREVERMRGNGDARCWIVLEGMGWHDARAPPLADVVKLRRERDVRVILDDSGAVGVMGARGAGSCSELGVAAADVDLVMFSLSRGLGSNGGVVVGCKRLVEHQVINSAAYCFSAAPPPYLARCATEVLRVVQEGDALREALYANVTAFVEVFRSACRAPLDLMWHPKGATLFLCAPPEEETMRAERRLQDMADRVRRSAVIERCKYSGCLCPRPSPRARVVVSALLQAEDVHRAAAAVAHAANQAWETPGCCFHNSML